MDIYQPEPNNGWTRVSYKRRSAQEGYKGDVKHTKESNHWLHPTSTSNRYTALLDEENGHQQQQHGPGNTSKPPPIYSYVSDVTTASPLTQPLEQRTKQQYELKALSNNQIKIQPETSESYRTITQALTEKQNSFKNMHYPTNQPRRN
jgi:hypothetical protein